jgi:hypothetical protein
LTIGVSAATSRRRFIRLIAFLSVIGGSIFLRTELFAQQPSRPPARDAEAEGLAKVTVHPPDAFYRPPTQVPDKPGALKKFPGEASGSLSGLAPMVRFR